MKTLKIAASEGASTCFLNAREVVPLGHTDFTDVAVAVVSVNDVLAGSLDVSQRTGFDIPIFLVASPGTSTHPREVYKHLNDVLLQVNGIFDLSPSNVEYHGNQLETAAKAYEASLLPPFFDALKHYTEAANATFACPGHQGGQFFRKHPAGRQFFDFFGETLFRADMCNADVKLGDLLIHE
ncbi:MAG: ornithine decarboxylase, partial [Pseudomonas fluorescens]|nr:ornithine decarboxylase [Pseudomonas fluorescens]